MVGQQLLVLPIGFAYLPFSAVAVYGMLEVALGNTDENLCGRIVGWPLAFHVYNPQRKGSQGMAAVSSEESFNELLADYPFSFGEQHISLLA